MTVLRQESTPALSRACSMGGDYMLGERTSKKFTEHSKVFTVEGNLSSGKGQLAQQIADKLGMKYFPEADIHYQDRISGEGKLLPEKFNGFCSLEKFYADPESPDGHSYRLQSWIFGSRVLQYADALEHLLSTGQGVVLERSPYSDFVFLDAMLKQGYVHKRCEFLPAKGSCLAIVSQKSGSLLLFLLEWWGEDGYSSFMGEFNFCVLCNESSEVLQYTATAAEDVEKVIEDIEYLKFDKRPWVEQDDVSFHHLRLYLQDKAGVLDSVSIPRFVPEITIGGSEYDKDLL
ncbi:NADH dehydrogenase [ubiquinone] 1 alpha subcomplex subunit 10, mitochondrial-like [Vidua chalybeata]|uniref:NADH dehydrogenase [ubiquinone] 1 alpha subcomplex subunit 10, mitochondrial-like n=1 Tax=Vidua chalybeata TaxID=81927 RepID=UPI0023A7C59A|nr:NADH dehydrogenase [ubiquinone] 1 alpha subcomplex subunit 10, mitochondrial-like [Vidua chalybeata]